jgi:hypothetical protein
MSVRGKLSVVAVAVAVAGSPLLLLGREARAATDMTTWSGYAGTEGGPVLGAMGAWTVPAVTGDGQSASWVGVDGLTDGWLIQAGTEQNANGLYYGWWEMIDPSTPDAGETFIDEPVRPGDQMFGEVQQVTAGTWLVRLDDVTAGWVYETDVAYGGPGETGDWVEEAPGGAGAAADWGTVRFSQMETFDGLGWVSSDVDGGDAIDLVDAGGLVLAAPGPVGVGAGGQTFDDVFGAATVPATTTSSSSATTVPAATSSTTTVPAPASTTTTTSTTTSTTSTTTTTVPKRPAPPHRPKPKPRPRPGPPSHVTVRPLVRAVQVRWTPPAGPAVGYTVREYRASGALLRTWTVRSAAATAGGLDWHDRYRFTVCTVGPGGVSVPSARTAPVRPRR